MTAVALMEAAQLMGHEVFVTEIGGLWVDEGRAWAKAQAVQLTPVALVEGRWIVPSPDISWAIAPLCR